MTNISEQVLTNINTKTGISKKTIILLSDLSPVILEYLRDQLTKVAETMQAKIDHLNFRSGWSKATITRTKTTLNLLDDVLDTAENLFNVIPWKVMAKNNDEVAWLIDVIKKNMAKSNGLSMAGFTIPGLQGINSVEDLRRKRDELSFQLQQMMNVQYYADSAKAVAYEEIRKIQRWIDTIVFLNNVGEKSFVFTGIIYSTSTSTIGWSTGTFTTGGVEYIVTAGTIVDMTVGDWYLYYDVGGAGASASFEATDGYYIAGEENKVRVAKLTVTTNTIINIVPYGSISYY